MKMVCFDKHILFATIKAVNLFKPIIHIVLIVLSVFCATHAQADEPKGNRILAVKANLGQSGDFEAAFNESLLAGSETQEIPLDWRDLETAPGQFEPQTNFLAIANFYYPAKKTPIHIAIRPVHTNQKVVPKDLLNVPLDSLKTIRRFKMLLDWMATQVPDVELTSLIIGSEIDIYAWGNAHKWNEWINFYKAVAPYARKKFPQTLIACETTYSAFTGNDLKHLKELHKHSDAIGVSYYPMKGELSGVKDPTSVHADFKTIVNAIDKKPIIFYQIGYPSSEVLGSSEQMQAQFITETFKAWDTHKDRILMLNFQWMHETPKAGLDYYAEYYEFDNANFRAFLGSLGFKSWEGVPKASWSVLIKEATQRGFGGK